VSALAYVGVALGVVAALAAGLRLRRSGTSILDGPDRFGMRALFGQRAPKRTYADRGDRLDPRDPRDLIIIVVAVVLFLGSAFWLIGYKLIGLA
jgi:hypothetical protein